MILLTILLFACGDKDQDTAATAEETAEESVQDTAQDTAE